MKKKIIILGSEGFIGSHLVRLFSSLDYQVAGCDLYEGVIHGYTYFKVSRLSPEWEDIFSGVQYDYCVNAAGSGNVPYSMSHPFTDFEANTLDTMRILESIRRLSPSCHYLHISSAAVYGNPERLPIAEDSSTAPLSPYGWHKLMSEQICKEYSSVYGLKTTSVRPFSVYGPGLKKQLFWDVYQKYRKGDRPLELWGTGAESRDFVYVEDLARAIHFVLLHAPMKGEIYNIAGGKEVKISEAMTLFLGFLDKGCEVRFNQQTREGDPLNWRADIGKISALGFQPKVSLEEGLKLTSGWQLQYL